MKVKNKYRKKRIVRKLIAATLMMLPLLPFTQVQATEIRPEEEINEVVNQQTVQDQVLEQFDFDELDQILEDIFPGERLRFGDIINGLFSGELTFSVELLGQLVSNRLLYEFHYNRESLIQILLIALIAAVFTNFSSVFRNQQISEISFYILYILLITICLNAFRVSVEGIAESLNTLLTFMTVLGPIYFFAVTIATGSSSSVVFYNLLLLLIMLVELLILNFLLPLINIYMLTKILNYLSPEDYLSKFSELLETIAKWTLKTLLAGIIGLNVVQGLIAPVIDSVRRSALTRGAEAIPGVGDALGGMADVVLGTAVLIKNGIGMTGAIIAVGITLVPLIEMVVLSLLYKMVAAVIQPISDKRIVGCISGIGEGCEMLVKVIFAIGALFLLTIAIVTASTT